jgi:RHS repeat-associated protein
MKTHRLLMPVVVILSLIGQTLPSVASEPARMHSSAATTRGNSITRQWTAYASLPPTVAQTYGPTASAIGSTVCSDVTVSPNRIFLPLIVRSAGGLASASVSQPRIPPAPGKVAPPLDRTIATDFASATKFLYTGSNPSQTGVATGVIDPLRAAVLRGQVCAPSGQPIAGAQITVLSHPEYGITATGADGIFDMTVNGGGLVTVVYTGTGYLPAQRQVQAPLLDYVWLPEVVLIPLDSAVTTIDLAAPGMQAARGSPVSDADGARQATILFPPGTTVTMTLPNGTTLPLTTLHVRATEYTVGDAGPKAMPALLPPSTGYTYAAELSVDEAVAAGASEVRFSQALPVYVENFLGFPVGTAVPTGYYDRQRGQWVASANGRVIKVLGITAGLADLDTDGDGFTDNPAQLAALGITDAERARLAQLYAAGQTLWRVPITHFTTYDCNWPYGPPSDAITPPPRNPKDPPVDNPNEDCLSVIGCENQSLGESVPVSGTPWQLSYRSQRTPGRKDAYTLHIPVSTAATVPATLRAMRVQVSIAGRLYRATLAPAPNLSYALTWDGLDGYGRVPQGAQLAFVQVLYDYEAQYYAVRSENENSFARAEAAGAAIAVSRAASTITLSKAWTARLGAWDVRALGLGGWSLSVQHAYNATSHTLLLGDGRQRSADALRSSVIATVAGNGVQWGFSGDGGPATEAQLWNPWDVAVGPDGSLYITDMGNHRIRRVAPNGIISTVAGNGGSGFSGDGGPATAAQIGEPPAVAVGLDGSLYIATYTQQRVRRVGPDGIITTIAGNGLRGPGGDGGPATAASLCEPQGLAVGTDGSLYIADFGCDRVRRVAPDGIITTVAGNGFRGYNSDGGRATATGLNAPADVAVGTDGSLYIADYGNNRIRRVAPDGIITTVAGGGGGEALGDGGPAAGAVLNMPAGVAVGPDGSLYIADLNHNRIRSVGPDGVINTIAGNGLQSYTGDGGPATATALNLPSSVTVGPDGSLYIADWLNLRIRRVRSALPDSSASDILLASEDSRELYIFDGGGRHLKTLDALTGALRYQFGYDANGYMTSITDGSGNVTTIERTGATATAIVAPGGQRTELVVNSSGWLASATSPAGEAYAMSYSADGLLQSFTDPLANLHNFTYDALGRLIKDEDPVGGSRSLVRTEQSNGYIVTTTSALGRSRTYQVEQLSTGAVRRTVTQASGAKTVTVIGTDGSEQTTDPDGAITTAQYGPDPRWGMPAPLLVQRVRTVPGGQTETLTGQRTVSLADPNNPLSLLTQTDSVTVNGRTLTRSYDAATRTLTDTSPEGRQTVSVLDAHGRVISQTPAAGVDPILVTFDSQGRVSAVSQATQAWTYAYDALNRVISRTDAAGRSTSYLYDAADRIITQTLPSGAAYQSSYDANGNRTEVMLPSGAAHALGYTAINLDAFYTPPGNASYLRTFNVDRQLTSMTLPAGRTTAQSYDAAGRVSGMTYPEAVTAFAYLTGATDQVGNIAYTPTTGPAQSIAYTYNGGLISGTIATGVAPAQVSYSYNNDFFLTSMNLSSGAATVQINLLWDNDGLLTGFGPFTFTRGGPGGALSQISDTASATDYSYDTLARIAARGHQVNAQTTYTMQLSYDTTGRVTGKSETAAGATITYAYAYDPDGQLTEVQRNGTVSEAYAYDVNGNRTSRQLGGGPAEAASYDSQDRLTQRGAVTYQFNADGFLAQRGADTFQYSTRGQLLGATVGGQAITYVYDGLGRRVSRTDGGGTTQYLYGDPASHLVTAVRGPAGELTTLFYDTAGLLIALERGGARYYVATDQAGAPRVVSDATGTPVKVVEYDSFGNVTADSAPAFALPIGYAGGLADAATGLVHFGYRDYDPAAGRWTARDPVLFAGGQGNLYVYVRNNPIGNRDPSGLFCVSVTLYEGVGGGVQTCITEDGASVCGEIGFGVGASVGADVGGDLEESGTSIVGELAYEYGGVEVGVGVSLDSGGCIKLTPKGQIGPITLEPGKAGLDLDVKGSKIGAGAEAKIAAKGCVKGKF